MNLKDLLQIIVKNAERLIDRCRVQITQETHSGKCTFKCITEPEPEPWLMPLFAPFRY
jgi:hypothetical protein